MINLCNINDCSGCMSCYSSCPQNAITIIENENGFSIPKINTDKCIECGLCVKSCPVLTKDNNLNQFNKVGYAAWTKDEKTRKQSSSGGLFYELAKHIINNSGIVCGASFDSNMKVKHILIDDINELNKLMGSKYVQSDTSDVFPKIKDLLNKKVYILFVGTPCQVAGLKSFLRKKYENLYTIDLVCHGVPSPLLWKKYIDYQNYKNKSRIIAYKFRNKKKSWTFFHSQLKFENGNIIEYDWFSDPWLRIYLDNKCLRDSCYNCRYTNMNRVSDITLSDFWGYNSFNKHDKNDDKGISLVIINSLNGNSLFNNIKNNLIYFDRNIKDISTSQSSLYKPWSKPKDTDLFWQDFNNLNFELFLNKHYKVAKPNDMCSFLAKHNYISLGMKIRNLKKKIKLMIK